MEPNTEKPKHSRASKENYAKPAESLTKTKLFQKFLLEELEKSKPKPKPKSPPKLFKLELNSSKFEPIVHTPHEISDRESSRVYSEQSEIQGFSQHIFASSPYKQYSDYPVYYQEPFNKTTENFKEDYEKLKETHESLKEDYEKMKQEFIQIMNEKEAELTRLRKDWESSKLDVMELEDKLRDSGSADTQAMEKKINVLLEQNQKLLEANRNCYLEAKSRYGEYELEVRMFKQRNEELVKDLMREKEKSEMIEVRMNTIKERASVIETTNLQSQDRILQLEHELDAMYWEMNALKKRASEKSDFYEMAPNTARNYNEDYLPRTRFTDEDSFSKKNPRNSIGFSNEPQNRLRNTQEKSPFQRQSLEQKLESLLNDKQKLEKEYAKIPDVCKNAAGKRRKEELELELEILETNVHNLRSKIRNRRG